MPRKAKPESIRRIVLDKGVSRPIGPYSHAVIAGGFVFVSGLGPSELGTGKYVEGGIKKQTRQVIRNVESVLKGMNLDLSDVVKANAYLRDIRDFERFNEAYREFFKGRPPARTTIQAVLPVPEILVEIDVIAKTRD